MRGFPEPCSHCSGAAAAAAPAEAGCAQESFEGNGYAVCRFDLRQDRLQLFSLDAEGEPYGSFSALADALEDQGTAARLRHECRHV